MRTAFRKHMILRISAWVAVALTFAVFLHLLAHLHRTDKQTDAQTEQAMRGQRDGRGRTVLPIGREAIIKRNIAEQIRILRSKPAADTSDTKSKGPKGTKMSKKPKKSSKSMSRVKKSSKRAKENDNSSIDCCDEGGSDNDFDISDCDSYSNDWLMELADSCDTDLDDLSTCECPSAGELLGEGILTCARPDQANTSPPACPKSCPVCEFCMVLEGCEDIYDS